MALRPKVKISQLNTCDKIDIFETTLPYSAANVTGWGNTNIDTSNITDARIEIFDQTGLTLLETIKQLYCLTVQPMFIQECQVLPHQENFLH
jgi:hypothetical protein